MVSVRLLFGHTITDITASKACVALATTAIPSKTRAQASRGPLSKQVNREAIWFPPYLAAASMSAQKRFGSMAIPQRAFIKYQGTCMN